MNTMTTSSGYVYREINVIYYLQRKINYQTVKPGLSAMKYRINLSFFFAGKVLSGEQISLWNDVLFIHQDSKQATFLWPGPTQSGPAFV